VELQTIVTPTNWLALYHTRGTNKDHAASFTVIHADNQTNEYRVAVFSGPSGDTNEFSTLAGPQAMIPFAGSDFWLADLGLEFLHWPAQHLLKKELRSGQACYVLESRSPGTNGGYGRVVSWLDIDSVRDAGQAAIVHADAYDAKGKLLKEFWPNEIKKVHGQWQLKEIEIRNVQTGSRTKLEFDLDKK